MRAGRLPSLPTFAACAAATLLLLGVGGFLFATSGIYDIAARVPHWAITRWFLEYSMRRAVETHSRFVEVSVPPEWRAGEDAVRLGAGHFHNGCAFCHGAPGDQQRPIARSMRPAPPDLARTAPHWTAEELFWIVRNGFKYTGMPHWPAVQRTDEVWPVVAFLQRLPDLDPAEYRRLVFGGAAGADEPGKPAALGACTGCHGDRGTTPPSRLAPRLDIQSKAVIMAALHQYADGSRPSGVMTPVAARLTPDQARALAAYYAAPAAAGRVAEVASPPVPPTGDGGQVERGRRIAVEGLSDAMLPPCAACHVDGSPDVFPRLEGQSASYVEGQLRLWRAGGRSQTPTGQLMAVIAQRLSEQQAADVAAYFESLGSREAAQR